MEGVERKGLYRVGRHPNAFEGRQELRFDANSPFSTADNDDLASKNTKWSLLGSGIVEKRHVKASYLVQFLVVLLAFLVSIFPGSSQKLAQLAEGCIRIGSRNSTALASTEQLQSN